MNIRNEIALIVCKVMINVNRDDKIELLNFIIELLNLKTFILYLQNGLKITVDLTGMLEIYPLFYLLGALLEI